MTVSPNDFKKWLARGRTGSPCIYHTGFLAVDRFHIINLNWPTQNEEGLKFYNPDPTVDTTARLALNAFEDGKVHLFQRKLHDNEYQYIAVKASRRLW